MSAQRSLGLILARNLLSSATTPGLLVSTDGDLLFYNEAAGALLGRPFEDSTGLTAREWAAEHGPYDETGHPIPFDQLPATQAIQACRPYHGEFAIRLATGDVREVAATAIPLDGPAGQCGALVLFWPVDGDFVAHAGEDSVTIVAGNAGNGRAGR